MNSPFLDENSKEYKELYALLKSLLETHANQCVALDVLEFEYGWEGR